VEAGEFAGNHLIDVVLKEGAPRLGRRTPSPDQILADGALGNLDPEFEKLAMDSRSTPCRVLPAHAADQFSGVGGNSWRASFAVADLPCPERPKQGSVPANHRLRLHNQQPGPPLGAQPRDSDPEEAVRCLQPRTLRRTPAKDDQLMAYARFSICTTLRVFMSAWSATASSISHHTRLLKRSAGLSKSHHRSHFGIYGKHSRAKTCF